MIYGIYFAIMFTEQGGCMANIRDVAKEAQVSITTISRYLSKDATLKITSETIDNIEKAINKLNYIYVPRNKPKGSAKRIGIISALTYQTYHDPFFSDILKGIEFEANLNNINIISILDSSELKKDKILDEFCSLNLDGVIVMENISNTTIERLKLSIKHIIFVDQYKNDYNCIGIDHFNATKQVMDFLLDNNYRNIAYIGGPVQNVDFLASYRTIAFKEALRLKKLEFNIERYYNCQWDISACERQTKLLLASKNRPDAIFAGSDNLAAVVLGVANQVGVKCPDEIAIIGFNGSQMSAHYIPALTTINVPTFSMGKKTIARLVEMFEGDNDVYNILFPTNLIIRNSVKIKEKNNDKL